MRRALLVVAAGLVLPLVATGCGKKDVVRPDGEAGKPAEAALSDTRELSETIRKMRESKTSEENVREAIGTLRKEREARAAASAVPPAGHGPGAVGAAGYDSSEQRKYARALCERIYKKWNGIAAAPSKGRAGAEVLVRIKIGKDGRVTNVRIERTSGNRVFDDSVLRAIKKASPLPAPPEHFRGTEDYYDVTLRFLDPAVPR